MNPRAGRMLCAAVVTLATAALSFSDTPAQDAAAAFDSLYGPAVKRVTATADPRDDVELAEQLLAAAQKAAGQPALLRVLCEKAHDLAARPPAGYKTAVEAMELLSQKVPDAKPACQEKLLALHQARYARGRPDERQAAGEAIIDLCLELSDEQADAGEWAAAAKHARKAMAVAQAIRSPVKDEILALLNELVRREKLERQAASLKARLKANEADRAARDQLIRLLVVELDDPNEAAKFVNADVADEKLRTYVPLAAKPVESLPESVLLELGRWYGALAAKALTASREDLYERAKTYLTAYLDKHTTDDLARTEAKLELDRIETALMKLSTSSDAVGWVDVLRLIDTNRHVSGGTWQRKGERLTVTAPEMARATIPVRPDGSYHLQVKFTRTEGSGAVLVALPVGSTWCALVLSANKGEASGLHMVADGPSTDNASTVRPGKLSNDKEYVLDARVVHRNKQYTITAMLNGQKHLKWEGPASDLSMGMWGMLFGRRALALGAMGCTNTFSSARLRLLSGDATVLTEATESGGGRFTRGRLRPGGRRRRR
ncbi:MAG TPA: hypothetical protein VNA25_21420 [Phycisphaerae bacterium]|nr:hypothetical protein [Phycisphaerae bacterium]HUT60413.1 hypothetical protein [Phycisphaerae bacterium]